MGVDNRTEEGERRDGIERRNGFEVNTKFGSIKAFGEGMAILLVVGMFTCAGGMFYIAHLVKDQLIALEASQRMTMCVLAVSDVEDRWAQITQPNSACSILSRHIIVPNNGK